MGSLSLIIVLIIVVWVIVLAPIVMGNNKPIRHSGDGYDATRVLHTGGSEPVAQRRRPKLSAADVHRHDDADLEEYEVVEAEAAPLAVTVLAEASEDELVDGEVVDDGAAEDKSGSTALSVLNAQDDERADDEHTDSEGQDFYEFNDSYASPGDYGYAEPEDAGDTETDSDTDDADNAEVADSESGELTDDEIAFAQNRRGRGGWDPVRERAARADRFQRRQRTLLGLIVADVIAFVAAFVAGGWAWAAPILTIALTVWYMVALRSVVRQERALFARRVRQLRRARLGVVTAEAASAAPRQRRMPGAVIVELDDESPDFSNLETHRWGASEPARVRYEYDDYHRAS
ncbi:gephyrin-like molybdotransferase receptor GlpR [Corynebacterium qintianiae]|uniref:divisome protein SepX/GlpR n=1 Tax=Corynebacterium qintianiae TaxID=2709392 RepID=UPI0013EA849C|nr:gephyrin-like molybdotransferase receptor GlpR [Corynebacterium qintianiae]